MRPAYSQPSPGAANLSAAPPAGRPVLIYDADCGFCQWSVLQGRRFLPVMPDLQALQTTDLARYGLTEQQALAAVQFVSRDGAVSCGHRAVAALLMLQPGFPFRVVGALLATPPLSWVARLGYRWVADHRYLLPGATDACAAPGIIESRGRGCAEE